MSAFETDEQLIGYCQLHCETPRALFHTSHINRILKLANYPEGYPQEPLEDNFVNCDSDCMLPLLKIIKEA